ncbi:arylsulfatase, partial [Defluviimonas sp. D31]|uniref:arylsulfatase n=1 Tax=Defluviimonas sp. D31 TaxID=3083253 RepID=UPI00296F57D2
DAPSARPSARKGCSCSGLLAEPESRRKSEINGSGAYHNGMMGGSTPNIDRIAKEGAIFTDAYAQQSCTAGRASFILGQHPFRTGLLTIGMPGAEQGIQDKDPTLAQLLKNHGYVSGQFGKNHLGDRDEHLPTMHGFDEFFGNLYHLNAEEEPESEFYPRDNKEFVEKFGPRGVLHTYAQPDGTQKIEDTGPLTRKRMETADTEFLDASIKFIEAAHEAGKPFFVWHNSTRMHVWTHLSEEYEGKSGYGLYADGMMELDDGVGRLLDKLDELGIADNTIVVFSTDNGAEKFTWPDGGTTPFRGEKGTTWEGGFRVPMMVRWPGTVEPGTVVNDIFSHEDWMPTLMAGVGEPDIKDKLLTGHEAGGKTFKAHLDGYNQMGLLAGTAPGERKEIFYFDAGGNLNAVRYNDWKIHFTIMEGSINEAYRKTPSWPLIVNLRMDPYEVGPDAALYIRQFYADQMWMFVPAQALVSKFLETFKEFPPTRGDSLSVDAVLAEMQKASSRQ